MMNLAVNARDAMPDGGTITVEINQTHISKAKEAGVTDDEIKHALLLLIPTVGFPTFMKAFSIFKGIS